MDVNDFKEVVCKFVLVFNRANSVDVDHKFGAELLQNTNDSHVCANTMD